MTIDLDKLAELARAATPGPWFPYTGSVLKPSVDSEKRGFIATVTRADPDEQDEANVAYIAAMSPDVALELIALARGGRDRDEMIGRLCDAVKKQERMVRQVRKWALRTKEGKAAAAILKIVGRSE